MQFECNPEQFINAFYCDRKSRIYKYDYYETYGVQFKKGAESVPQNVLIESQMCNGVCFTTRDVENNRTEMLSKPFNVLVKKSDICTDYVYLFFSDKKKCHCYYSGNVQQGIYKCLCHCHSIFAQDITTKLMSMYNCTCDVYKCIHNIDYKIRNNIIYPSRTRCPIDDVYKYTSCLLNDKIMPSNQCICKKLEIIINNGCICNNNVFTNNQGVYNVYNVLDDTIPNVNDFLSNENDITNIDGTISNDIFLGSLNLCGWTKNNHNLRTACIINSDCNIVCVQETHLGKDDQ